MPFELDDQRLVSAIRQIAGTENDSARDRYAAELANRFPGAAHAVRSADAENDLAAIVHSYLGQRRGLSVFVDVLAKVHGDSDPLQRLRWLVNLNDGPPSALSDPQREQLLDLLTQVATDEVERAAQRAAPRLAELQLDDPPDFDGLIRDLEDAIAAPGEPAPVVAFLSGLSAGLRARDPVDEGSADQATSLAHTVAGQLGSPPAFPPKVDAETAGDRRPTFLVVRLRPDGIDFRRYIMEVWLNSPPDNWEQWFQEDRRLTIDEVRDELDTLLDRLSHAPQSRVSEFMVEFILPPALIEYPVDQWIVNGPGIPAPIGVHFPVMVRDLDRMGNQFARAPWHQRWNWLNRHGKRVDAEAVFWEWLGTRHEPTELYGELTRENDRPVCLVLLKSGDPDQLPGAVKVAVTAGLPAVVWCRNAAVETQFNRTMHQLLMGRGLLGLTHQIWQLRKDAVTQRSVQHIGRHLTLLWDMANRVPPEDTLEAPA